MRIVAISDTHNMHGAIEEIPDGDVLIHAGDISVKGTSQAIYAFNRWLGELPHKHKIVIAGNHDFCLQNDPRGAEKLFTNAIYLRDNSVSVGGLKFYGTPWVPKYGRWAFMIEHDSLRNDIFKKIPNDVDVLISHGPPKNILDYVPTGWKHAGCASLRDHVLERIKPKAHIFGHIHEAYGYNSYRDINFYNVSICDAKYSPDNPATVIEL
jgi:Icc-related predicted phosphoesterase